MIASVYARMRRHALTRWPFALLWCASLMAALYTSYVGSKYALAWWLISVWWVLLWEVIILRAMTGGEVKSDLGMASFKYALSNILYAIIIVFAAVIILLPVILATLALMALVSFDPDLPKPTEAETEAAWLAFRSHPLFYVCVAIFAAGLAGLFTAAMRGIAFAAASVAERRVVAMEAFHWTRHRGLFLLGVGLGVLVPFLVMVGGGVAAMETSRASSPAANLFGCLIFALTLWPALLAMMALSAEVYERFRAPDMREVSR